MHVSLPEWMGDLEDMESNNLLQRQEQGKQGGRGEFIFVTLFLFALRSLNVLNFTANEMYTTTIPVWFKISFQTKMQAKTNE